MDVNRPERVPVLGFDFIHTATPIGQRGSLFWHFRKCEWPQHATVFGELFGLHFSALDFPRIWMITVIVVSIPMLIKDEYLTPI